MKCENGMELTPLGHHTFTFREAYQYSNATMHILVFVLTTLAHRTEVLHFNAFVITLLYMKLHNVCAA